MRKDGHAPLLIVIAGPNGSGKTTITSEVLKRTGKREKERRQWKISRLFMPLSQKKILTLQLSNSYLKLTNQ